MSVPSSPDPEPGPGPRRSTAVRLVVAAVLCMILGTVVPPLIADFRTLVPTEHSATFRTEPTEGRVLNLAALANGEIPPQNASRPECAEPRDAGLGCYQLTGPVTVDRTTTTAKAEVFSEVEVDSDLTVRFEGFPVAEVTDHSVLARASAMPVTEPVAETVVSIPSLDTDVTSVASYRTGVTHFFPPTSERRSYPYFDLIANTSTPIDFVDEAAIGDVEVYTYAQHLDAVDLLRSAAGSQNAEGDAPDSSDLESALERSVTDYSSGMVALNRMLTGPAERFYSDRELAELGLAADEVVQPSPYYTVRRVLTVEPDTGVILDAQETYHVVLARSPDEAEATAQQGPHPARTAFWAETRWDEATRQAQLDRVTPTLRLFRVLQILAWVFTTAAFLLLLAAVVTIVRMRAARRERLLAVAP